MTNPISVCSISASGLKYIMQVNFLLTDLFYNRCFKQRFDVFSIYNYTKILVSHAKEESNLKK